MSWVDREVAGKRAPSVLYVAMSVRSRSFICRFSRLAPLELPAKLQHGSRGAHRHAKSRPPSGRGALHCCSGFSCSWSSLLHACGLFQSAPNRFCFRLQCVIDLRQDGGGFRMLIATLPARRWTRRAVLSSAVNEHMLCLRADWTTAPY